MRSERARRESLVQVSGGSIAPKPSRWPILADWRHTRATGHSAGRSSDDYTLDTSPEEMADGDPQMAECLWRCTLAGAVVARYDALSSA